MRSDDINDDDDIGDGEGGSVRWNDGGRVAGVKTREDFYCNTLPSTSLFYTLFALFNLSSSSSLFSFVNTTIFINNDFYCNIISTTYLFYMCSVFPYGDTAEMMILRKWWLWIAWCVCVFCIFVHPLFGTECQRGCRCLVRCSKCQKINQRFLKYPNIKLIANIYHLS